MAGKTRRHDAVHRGYVVQAALGGHAIPIDAGTMAALRVLDLVTEKDVAAGVVPGLERAVAKSKGVEFGSLLHELGADYSANPYSSAIRDILLQIDPDCAEPPAQAPGRSRRSGSRTSRRRRRSRPRKRASRVSGEIRRRRRSTRQPTPRRRAGPEPPKKKTASPHRAAAETRRRGQIASPKPPLQKTIGFRGPCQTQTAISEKDEG